MRMLTVDCRDNVVIVRLNRGVTNPMNIELVNELAKAFQRVKRDIDVHGLVLSSSNEKFFSIGFDIPQLFELDREDFTSFYQAFNDMCLDLYTLPKPTVAAITGHAIAGGCIVALCCDYRFVAEGRKLMGLNEIKLGVSVPYLADCVLRSMVGVRIARDIVDTGEFYRAEQSFQMGMVDGVVPLERVLSESIEKSKSLGALPQRAFELIKRNRVESVKEQFLQRRREKERLFIDRWYSDETRERLREAIKKF